MLRSIFNHPITELMLNVLVLMAVIAGMKLLLNLAPDGGLVGDVKKFFMLA